jgi:hypothetical protein
MNVGLRPPLARMVGSDVCVAAMSRGEPSSRNLLLVQKVVHHPKRPLLHIKKVVNRRTDTC